MVMEYQKGEKLKEGKSSVISWLKDKNVDASRKLVTIISSHLLLILMSIIVMIILYPLNPLYSAITGAVMGYFAFIGISNAYQENQQII
ncbi:MAG: hypothetical protein INQ03_01440 [Candidatus Heimdallarchaeota archaeon]|nr:hypothetical protein [Candidatus Heimdallarchaeota archaeon]